MIISTSSTLNKVVCEGRTGKPDSAITTRRNGLGIAILYTSWTESLLLLGARDDRPTSTPVKGFHPQPHTEMMERKIFKRLPLPGDTISDVHYHK